MVPNHIEPGLLTLEEQKAIAALKRLAKKWPKTLGLWGGMGDLTIVALDEDGALQHEGSGGSDTPVYSVASVDLPTGGGDPDWRDFYALERTWVPDDR